MGTNAAIGLMMIAIGGADVVLAWRLNDRLPGYAKGMIYGAAAVMGALGLMLASGNLIWFWD